MLQHWQIFQFSFMEYPLANDKWGFKGIKSDFFHDQESTATVGRAIWIAICLSQHSDLHKSNNSTRAVNERLKIQILN